MNNKILVISPSNSNVLESVTYKLKSEQIDYIIKNDISDIEDNNISFVIALNISDLEQIDSYASSINIPVIVITSNDHNSINIISKSNIIKTKLFEDKSVYSNTQKEFLFRKDIYSTLNDIVIKIINTESMIDKMIFDLRDCQYTHNDWIFEFDSIGESYSWLMNKDDIQDKNNNEKIINFYLDRLYNDSDKEIKYLINKIKNVKNGKRITDIFVCSKEELEKYKKNNFFKLLTNYVSDKYKIYILDKDLLINSNIEVYNKLVSGIIIYEDCVYRDYSDNEYTLGFVDCKPETLTKYNEIYDYLLKLDKLEIKKASDLDGF